MGRKFDLYHYWGPVARAKVGRWISVAMQSLLARTDAPDHLFVYLPTLDYDLQRHGPDSPQAAKALAEFMSQLELLIAAAEAQGRDEHLRGDHGVLPQRRGTQSHRELQPR